MRPPGSGQSFCHNHKSSSNQTAHPLDAAGQIFMDMHIFNTSEIRSDPLSALDVLQQGAVSGNGLLDLFFCGFVHSQ